MDLEALVELSAQRDKLGGIDLSKLPPGTKFEIHTVNSRYLLEKLDYGNRYNLQGGEYFPETKEVRIPGSTFGGSTIRVNWIGYLMRLEIYDPERKGVIHTSSIRQAKIITPTYEYSLEWPDPEDTSGNKAE